MSAYMHVCICAYALYVHVCSHACTYSYMNLMCMYIFIYAPHVHVHIHICTSCACTCSYMCLMCMYMFIYASHMHVHVHICISGRQLKREGRETRQGASGSASLGFERLEGTSVDQSSRAWMATCLPALSTRFSSAQRALARALWLASPAAAVQVIVCSEPTNVDRWRRRQPGMSSSGVMLPSAPSRARQHDSQKQQ
jgi:hypothetical protein